jgi:hypothetical protein
MDNFIAIESIAAGVCRHGLEEVRSLLIGHVVVRGSRSVTAYDQDHHAAILTVHDETCGIFSETVDYLARLDKGAGAS